VDVETADALVLARVGNSPTRDGGHAGPKASLYLAIALPFGYGHPCAEHIARGQGPGLGPPFQFLFLFCSQREQVSIIRHALQTIET